MRASSYCIVVRLPGEERALLFHGYSGAVDLVHEKVVELLDEPRRDIRRGGSKASEATIALLTKRGYLTDRSPVEEQEFVRELGERVHRVSRRHAPAGFLIIPTYSCNLRCPYCYEKTLRRHGTEWMEKCMDRETADAAFEAMDRIHPGSGKRKSLSFYGGEPLQRENRAIVEHIFQRALEKGFTAFSAITNGVDLDQYLDLLGPERRIRFIQVTLDGPPEVHDQRRFFADGSGTFHRIIENITKALETQVQVSVRVNVDRSNLEGLAALRAILRERGWDRQANFRAYCSPVHGSLDGCRVAHRESFEGHLDMQRAIEQTLQDRGEPLEVYAVTNTLTRVLVAHLRHEGIPRWKTGFCGSNMAMHLLDPHGDIYPCWEVVGHVEHRIGRYEKGSVWMEPIQAEKWHERSVVRVRGCLECAYLFFCGGGCEAVAYQKRGFLDGPECSDFPEIFQRAALKAYAEFLRNREEGSSPDSGGREQGSPWKS